MAGDLNFLSGRSADELRELRQRSRDRVARPLTSEVASSWHASYVRIGSGLPTVEDGVSYYAGTAVAFDAEAGDWIAVGDVNAVWVVTVPTLPKPIDADGLSRESTETGWRTANSPLRANVIIPCLLYADGYDDKPVYIGVLPVVPHTACEFSDNAPSGQISGGNSIFAVNEGLKPLWRSALTIPWTGDWLVRGAVKLGLFDAESGDVGTWEVRAAFCRFTTVGSTAAIAEVMGPSIGGSINGPFFKAIRKSVVTAVSPPTSEIIELKEHNGHEAVIRIRAEMGTVIGWAVQCDGPTDAQFGFQSLLTIEPTYKEGLTLQSETDGRAVAIGYSPNPEEPYQWTLDGTASYPPTGETITDYDWSVLCPDTTVVTGSGSIWANEWDSYGDGEFVATLTVTFSDATTDTDEHIFNLPYEPPEPAELDVLVYGDADADGSWDGEMTEGGLPFRYVEAEGIDVDDGALMPTDEDGHAVFASLTPGTYSVRIYPTSLYAGEYVSSSPHPVTVPLTAGASADIQIGIASTGSGGGPPPTPPVPPVPPPPPPP